MPITFLRATTYGQYFDQKSRNISIATHQVSWETDAGRNTETLSAFDVRGLKEQRDPRHSCRESGQKLPETKRTTHRTGHDLSTVRNLYVADPTVPLRNGAQDILTALQIQPRRCTLDHAD